VDLLEMFHMTMLRIGPEQRKLSSADRGRHLNRNPAVGPAVVTLR
jgi:hypothetical protein